MRTTAVISSCGKYRYYLGRCWDNKLPVLSFIMLNPSTADAEIDDHTIRRCIGFAKLNGFGGIAVVNLFAFRATEPSELYLTPDPFGPDNVEHLKDILFFSNQGKTKIVAAWGAHKAVADFKALSQLRGAPLYCLGKTKDGHPRHPLYVRADQPLEVFQ
jgi:hypothetical protein